jgi:hypothetical protein
MLRLMIIVLAVFTLGLGACAPATNGVDPTHHINLDEENAVVTPGNIWYLSSSWSPRAFKLTLPRLTERQKEYAIKGSRYRSKIDAEYTVWQLGLPDNWGVYIHSVDGVKEITEIKKVNKYFGTIEWNESVEVTLAVSVPADAVPGMYTGMVSIEIDGGIQILPIEIQIEGSTGSQI